RNGGRAVGVVSGTIPPYPAPAVLGARGGLQPGRLALADGQRGAYRPAVGDEEGRARRPALRARRYGPGGGVQPGWADDPDRQRGQDRPAVGRRDGAADWSAPGAP